MNEPNWVADPVPETTTCPFKKCWGTNYSQIKWRDIANPGTYPSNVTVSTCDCHYLPYIRQQWKQTVGEHDRWVKLGTLEPSDKSKLPTNIQQKCIETMRKYPLDSYCMLGGSGTSKTTFAIGLYRYGLGYEPSNYDNVIRVKAKTLLETIQKYRFDENFKRENNPPFTTAKRITAQASGGHRTRLYLEELEKVKYTEFKSTEIFDIIDALYETNGRLVLTGNLTYADLNDTSKFPEGFARRVTEICTNTRKSGDRPHLWDFWKYGDNQ
jgi:hypothetical protein